MSARSASPVVKEQTNAHAEKAVAAIRTLLSYEATFQDTQNVEDLAEKRAQWLSTYKGAYTCDPAQGTTKPPLFGTPNVNQQQSGTTSNSTSASATFGTPSPDAQTPLFGHVPPSSIPFTFGANAGASTGASQTCRS